MAKFNRSVFAVTDGLTARSSHSAASRYSRSKAEEYLHLDGSGDTLLDRSEVMRFHRYLTRWLDSYDAWAIEISAEKEKADAAS